MLKQKTNILTFLLLVTYFLVFSPIALAALSVDMPTSSGLPSAGIKDILVNILKWMLGIVGIIALISFVISGMQYFFAVGDERNMEAAKRNFVYSILGIIVALSGYIIVSAINMALNASSSSF